LHPHVFAGAEDAEIAILVWDTEAPTEFLDHLHSKLVVAMMTRMHCWVGYSFAEVMAEAAPAFHWGLGSGYGAHGMLEGRPVMAIGDIEGGYLGEQDIQYGRLFQYSEKDIRASTI
jgi:hypothetical protein